MTFNERVFIVVRHIPAGRVLSYGAVARLLGSPRGSRAVGWALRTSSANGDVPWQRVINAEGYISTQSPDHDPIEHRRRLEAEGIHFDANEKVDFKRFGWSPTPDELIELHLALTL